jgi:hypothetical protein
MKTLMTALLLAACSCQHSAPQASSTPTAPAASGAQAARAAHTGPVVRLWSSSESRKIDGHWVLPTLHARASGADLQIDIAVAVGSETEVTAADVTAKLYADGTQLTCSPAESQGYTETLAITAQITVYCTNSAHVLPTQLVVEVKHSAETFALQLSSLTTAG